MASNESTGDPSSRSSVQMVQVALAPMVSMHMVRCINEHRLGEEVLVLAGDLGVAGLRWGAQVRQVILFVDADT
ncbi:hypothetical protein PG989_001353 [Apiospora arundinis]